MSKSLNVNLVIPQELGSAILADKQLQQLINDTPGVEVQTRTTTTSASEEFRDGGALLIAIASAPAAVAAVKGLFELFRIIAEKSFELRKLRMEQEHEITKLQLEIGQRSIALPLDQDLSVINNILEREIVIIMEQIDKA